VLSLLFQEVHTPSVSFIIIVALVSLTIGLSKGGLGAVLVLAVTPLLSQVMPVVQAISISLPLLIIGDIFALRVYWKQWDMHYVRLMLPAAVLGIIVGNQLLVALPDRVLRPILGVLVLLFVVYKVAGERLREVDYHPQNWHGYVAGAASGLGSALANSGSPPFTIYMMFQDISPQVFIGTTTLFFAIVNLIKVPGLMALHLIDLHDLVGIAWAVPLIPLGVWAGRKLIDRINKVAFERMLLGVLALAGVILIFVPPR
jgi:uncharacterized protein